MSSQCPKGNHHAQLRKIHRSLYRLPIRMRTHPLLRVYTFADDIQKHLEDVDEEFLGQGASAFYLNVVYTLHVYPAEVQAVDFLTSREIKLVDLQSAGAVRDAICATDYYAHFPRSYQAQTKLKALAQKLGMRSIMHYAQMADFITLCNIANQVEIVLTDDAVDMWERYAWKSFFIQHPQYCITLPFIRAIKTLQGVQTPDEWGARRELFFGRTTNDSFSDEDDEITTWE